MCSLLTNLIGRLVSLTRLQVQADGQCLLTDEEQRITPCSAAKAREPAPIGRPCVIEYLFLREGSQLPRFVAIQRLEPEIRRPVWVRHDVVKALPVRRPPQRRTWWNLRQLRDLLAC